MPGADGVNDKDDDDAIYKRYRTIFISDVHLGTPGCQAEAPLDFLKAHPSDTLYLVGDIFDGWQLRRKWYWPQSLNDVVQKLLRRARKGCRVIYVPGNHDEFASEFIGNQFGGKEVIDKAVHVTADGRQLWIIHGDWVESRTALVEHVDGLLELIHWAPAREAPARSFPAHAVTVCAAP